MGQPEARSVSEIPHGQELDKLLASLILASLVLHFGFVFFLHQLDWPREPEAIPDQYWHLLPPRAVFAPPPPPPVKTPASSPRGATARHSARVPAPGGAAAVARVAVLQALGGESMHELLTAGSVDADRAFERMGGVSLESRGGLELRSKLEIGSKRDGEHLRVDGPRSVSVGGRGQERLLPPQVRITPPESVIGGLPPEVIVAAVRQRLSGIRACFERSLDHEHSGGKITLHFSVTPAGAVDAVDVEQDTLGSAAVTTCMKERVAGWRFPPSPRASEFSFPFIFQSAE
jgi:hypothetical protein